MGNTIKNVFLSIGIVISGLILFVVSILLLYVSYVLAFAFALIATMVVVYNLLRHTKEDLPE